MTFTSVRSVTKPRLRPLYSRPSHQYPVQGCWTCYTVQGINSVQQTVKSPPLPPPLSKRVGACECGKRIPRAVSFHSASVAAAETGSTVTWAPCALDQLSILGALFHFPASLNLIVTLIQQSACRNLLHFNGTHSFAYLVPSVLSAFDYHFR